MKLFFAIIFSLIIHLSTMAQMDSLNNSTKLKFKKENIFIDGNISLRFVPALLFNFSPVVGYRITPKLLSGVGLIYRNFNNGSYSNNSYGWQIFTRYYPVPRFFIHSSFEQLYVPNLSTNQRIASNNVLIGAGYVQNVGKASFYIMTVYNLTPNRYYGYPNPFYRAGVTTSF